MTIKDLQPKAVWENFYGLTRVPRPSKHEGKVQEYLLQWGKDNGIDVKRDKTGNIIFTAPATPGMENRKGVIMQAHMDMVPQKSADTVHDFLTDPIETRVLGEWVGANGTTLGADNGIGIALALSVLQDKTLRHGPLEVLVTYDEETGMSGAIALEPGVLKGDILLNLDSEDEGEIFIGCAGGVRNTATFKHLWQPIAGDMFYMKVDINSLTGGHSGDDISKGRANANKLLVRFLLRIAEKYEFYLCDISGGSLHNAIPRDASAVFAVQSADKEAVRVDFNLFAAEVQDEYSVTEPNAKFTLQSTDPVKRVIDPAVAKNLLRSLHSVFNGVFAMSQDVPGLVETSSNLASVKRTSDNTITVTTSQRSSIESARDNVSSAVRTAFELGGANVTTKGQYPGWKPNMKSEILKVACDTYKQLFGEDAKIKAIHAGLECGLFLEKAPHLDMISFGPTMRGVHSPDERLDIASTGRWWQHLQLLLENAPVK